MVKYSSVYVVYVLEREREGNLMKIDWCNELVL